MMDNRFHNLYRPLIGATITDFETEPNEDDPNHPWLIFKIRKGADKKQLTISRDPEGNGGGFIFIDDE